jgi:hypothetical protein
MGKGRSVLSVLAWRSRRGVLAAGAGVDRRD